MGKLLAVVTAIGIVVVLRSTVWPSAAPILVVPLAMILYYVGKEARKAQIADREDQQRRELLTRLAGDLRALQVRRTE
jgi:hypothetical protein